MTGNPLRRPVVSPSVHLTLFVALLVAGILALGAPSIRAAAAGTDANDPLALTGLDPVLLVRGERVAGREDLTVERGGLAYRFARPDTRAAFEADPDRYRIQNRTCPVAPGAQIDPAQFAVHDGKIWAFATADCVETFKENPASYLQDLRTFEAGSSSAPRRVAVVVYQGVELLDFAGPGEVFAAADHRRAFDVFTVGPSREPVISQGFVEIVPTHGFASAPKPDLLVIPGGNIGTLVHDPEAMDWLRRTAGEADVVLSVCNGALVLAHAGLLDGLEATTHHGALTALRKIAPTARVVSDRRFVDNGHIVTAAGVSAGIDASLHLVRRLLGPDQAEVTARYMEYPSSWEEGDEKVAATR